MLEYFPRIPVIITDPESVMTWEVHGIDIFFLEGGRWYAVFSLALPMPDT